MGSAFIQLEVITGHSISEFADWCTRCSLLHNLKASKISVSRKTAAFLYRVGFQIDLCSISHVAGVSDGKEAQAHGL